MSVSSSNVVASLPRIYKTEAFTSTKNTYKYIFVSVSLSLSELLLSHKLDRELQPHPTHAAEIKELFKRCFFLNAAYARAASRAASFAASCAASCCGDTRRVWLADPEQAYYYAEQQLLAPVQHLV